MNAYPHHLIKHLISKFETASKNQTKDSTKDNTETENKPSSTYKGLSYTPILSENLRSLLTKHDNEIKIGFKPYTTVNKICKTPYTPIPTMEKHNVIYAIDCKNCDGQYIGQTGQKLKDRLKQHTRDQIAKTPKQNNTAAYHHTKNTGHTLNFEKTRILATENHLQKRLTIESININLYKNTAVNLKSDIDTLNPAYTQLLKNLKL